MTAVFIALSACLQPWSCLPAKVFSEFLPQQGLLAKEGAGRTMTLACLWYHLLRRNGIHPFYCWAKDHDQEQHGKKRSISSYWLSFFMKESQGRISRQEGALSQKLTQRTWRDAACWLSIPAQNGRVLLYQTLIKKMPQHSGLTLMKAFSQLRWSHPRRPELISS